MAITTFCSVSDVRAKVNTDLTDSEIEQYIKAAAARIIKRTGTSSVSSDEDTEYFKEINALIAAYKIVTTMPHTLRRRGLQTVHYPTPEWRQEINEFFILYEEAPVTSYDQPIDEIQY